MQENNATVRRMPTPQPSQDPHAYTAPCDCCGQVIAIRCFDKNPPAVQLAEIATEQCFCDGAKRKRVLKRAAERIPELFGEKCSPVYGGPVDEKVLPWLLEAALLTATGHISGIAIKLNDEEAATFKAGHESVDISRKRIKQAKSKI
jgi:hypothetical protein